MVRPGVVALILLSVGLTGLGVMLSAPQGTLAEVYTQVFMIVCGDGFGTGWWVNNTGYAVTAYHVIDECMGEGVKGVRWPWTGSLELVAYDTELDVALLRAVDPPEWAQGLPLSYSVSLGDEVLVIGYPVQLVAEAKDPLLASEAPRAARATVVWLHPSAPIFEFSPGTDAGNSGGPVVSVESGGVVGIVVYARKGVVSEGFYALRMDALAEFLDGAGVQYDVARGSDMATILVMVGLAAVAVAVLFMVLRGR